MTSSQCNMMSLDNVTSSFSIDRVTEDAPRRWYMYKLMLLYNVRLRQGKNKTKQRVALHLLKIRTPFLPSLAA